MNFFLNCILSIQTFVFCILSLRTLREISFFILHGMAAEFTAKPGNHLGDIGEAVQKYTESNGFSVVRDLVGHGVGKFIHEAPEIPNYGKSGKGLEIKEGMTLALEPMINVGDWRVEILSDSWTFVTCDKKLSAHFEHTIAITKNGPEILTKL